MKKSISVILSSLMVCLLTTVVQAEESPRIAYVDLQTALTKSKEGKKAQQLLKGEVERAKSKIDKKKKELEQRQKDYARQQESLNIEARASKEEELISLKKDLGRSFQDT